MQILSDQQAIAQLRIDCVSISRAIAQRLHSDRRAIAQRSHSECITIAQRLQSDFTVIAKWQNSFRAIGKQISSDQ
jgi:hypothetical protein